MHIAPFERSIVFSSAAWLALPHFATLLHKQHDFREKIVEHETFVLIFSTTLI